MSAYTPTEDFLRPNPPDPTTRRPATAPLFAEASDLDPEPVSPSVQPALQTPVAPDARGQCLMFCPRCGTPSDGRDPFCVRCGARRCVNCGE